MCSNNKADAEKNLRKITSQWNRNKTMDLVYCAIFTALIAVGAFIKIPIPVIPFTLQTFFIMMAGMLLGGKKGAVSAIVYMLLGLVGLPIFAAGGGIWYVLKPSFGYIIGFCAGAFIIGKITENLKEISFSKLLWTNLLGLAAIYVCGLIYFYIICNYVINTPIALWPLILQGFLMVVPGDIGLTILAAFLGKRIIPIIKKEK